MHINTIMASKPKICLLPRTVVRVTGDHVRDFFQGLVTNDLRKLSPEKPLYSALLTPQGRFLFDFFLLDTPDILLEVSASHCEALIKKLCFYRLRAKVFFEPLKWYVYARWGDSANAGGVIFCDPRLADMGERILSPTPLTTTASPEEFLSHRLSLGVPDTEDLEGLFPLEGNLDYLNGVDFHKGCYVGQEVTSRVKRRGTVRKRLFPVCLDTCPPAGTAIFSGARAVGEIRSGVGRNALGLVRVDKLNTPLTANTISLEIRYPSYLPLSLTSRFPV